MDREITIMIYGAIMGVVGSILSSIVTMVFQLWLTRRENDRRQKEERGRRLRHIHLPTDEEVIKINSVRQLSRDRESPRKTAETGTIALSVFISGLLVYQTNDLVLSFAFAAMLGFLMTKRLIRALKG